MVYPHALPRMKPYGVIYSRSRIRTSRSRRRTCRPMWWDACRHDLPAYEPLEPWVIALDAAVSGDCFGLVAVTRKNGIIIPRYVRKWTPPAGGQIMYNAPAGTPPERDESPAGELRRICARHSVVKVVYDPFQLHSFCNQMKEELIVYFSEFPQTTKRLLADKALRDTIRERKIWQDGNYELREHITNANAKSEGESDKLRIVKRTEKAKIDLAVMDVPTTWFVRQSGTPEPGKPAVVEMPRAFQPGGVRCGPAGLPC